MAKEQVSVTLEEVLRAPITRWERLRYRVKAIVEDLPWWFRWRFQRKHQYNLLRTGLRPGYYDPDVRILWAVMGEVERFVAHETGPHQITDWEADPEHRAAFAAFQAAAAWWQAHRERLFEWVDWDEEERMRAEALDHLGAVVRHLWFMWY